MITLNHYKRDTVILVLTENSVEQLQYLLNRALNCLPPHDPKWKEWFELSDKIEKNSAIPL